MKISVVQASRSGSVRGLRGEAGLGYAGPGALRLGSTGTLGRRARGADGHAGPSGRAGPGLPADGLWRPERPAKIESLIINLNFESSVEPFKRRVPNRFERFYELNRSYTNSVSLCH